MVLPNVMKESNDLYAAHHNPPKVKVESPRILRRRQAISLIQSNVDIDEDDKVKVVKQFVHDSDKVETYLELGNTSLGSQVMREWASEKG